MRILPETIYKKSEETMKSRAILPKKLVSAMLMLFLIFSSLAVSPNFNFTASALGTSGYWDFKEGDIYKYADFSPFTNSSASIYTIKNAAQLAALAILVNEYAGTADKTVTGAKGNNNTATCSNFQGKYIKLTADIDLGKYGNETVDYKWVPIGLANNDDSSPTNIFQGNFDGQGHTISNMHSSYNEYACAGLFGYVYASENLDKNLDENLDENSDENKSGNVTIQKINIDKSCYINGSINVGGICGCATVSSDVSVKLTIINCSNNGEITATGSASAGGICGYASSSSTLDIINCGNSGKITATATATNSTAYAGGICGYANAADSSKINMKICINSGEITATSDDVYAGEICGECSGTINATYIVYRKEKKICGNGNISINDAQQLSAEKMQASESDKGSAVSLLNGYVSSYNSAGENVIKALKWTNGIYNNPVHMLFSAQTTLGYSLQKITSESKQRNIELPDLYFIEDDNNNNNNLNSIQWHHTKAIDDAIYDGTGGDNEQKAIKAAVEEKFQKDIEKGLADGQETIIITAKYCDNTNPTEAVSESYGYNIIEVVDNGKLYVGLYSSDEKEPGAKVKIEAKGEKKFSHWECDVDNDDELEKISYRSPYYLYAYTHKTIVAVYSNSESVTAQPITNIERIEKIEDNGVVKVKIVSMSSVPDDYEIEWVGLIASTSKGGIEKTISIIDTSDNAVKDKKGNIYIRAFKPPQNQKNAQFNWTNKQEDNECWYVRSYLQYKDSMQLYGEKIFTIEIDKNKDLKFSATNASQSEKSGED